MSDPFKRVLDGIIGDLASRQESCRSSEEQERLARRAATKHDTALQILCALLSAGREGPAVPIWLRVDESLGAAERLIASIENELLKKADDAARSL